MVNYASLRKKNAFGYQLLILLCLILIPFKNYAQDPEFLKYPEEFLIFHHIQLPTETVKSLHLQLV